MTDLTGQCVVVMGLGRFGGGVGAARFLATHGADVLVTDRDPPDKLQAGVEQLTDLDIAFRLGEHRESDFASADLIVVNPAVPPFDNPYLVAAQRAGVPLTTEVALLIERLPNPSHVLAITGSAGKSTSAALTAHLLAAAIGDAAAVHLGGNIGGSLLPHVDDIADDDFVVLELSSFQLHYLLPRRWSPHLAAATSFAPNHLDWHRTLEHYEAAKRSLFAHQSAEDIAVLPAELSHWGGEAKHLLPALPDPPPTLLLPGSHNLRNAATALTLAAAALDRPVDDSTLRHALGAFAGLPHRLQLVAEHADVRYFNDSKSTTPASATLAIEAFPPDTAHVILGGYDKGSDLTDLARHARDRAHAVYTIGQTGPTLAEAVGETAVRCGTLEQAMLEIAHRIRRGDVVLLSPGCASWDQFDDFEQRGRLFVEHVLRTTGEGSAAPRV